MPTVLRLKIVSGGQTGVDRDALDWAIAHDIPHGGWCPEGRLAEDGIIPDCYQLSEVRGGGYRERTRQNVRDSDATLIISTNEILAGGSAKTEKYARGLGRPCLHVWPSPHWREDLAAWLSRHRIGVLNVAGPRASGDPGAGAFAVEVLDSLLEQLRRQR